MPHYEIYVSDMEQAQTFYGGLFGWNFTAMEGELAQQDAYHLIDAPDIGFDKGITAGMLLRPEGKNGEPPAGGPIRGGTMTFEVKDCDERYAWALANGGGEALPPADYPGIGRAAYVEDGQGNVVGFITPEKD